MTDKVINAPKLGEGKTDSFAPGLFEGEIKSYSPEEHARMALERNAEEGQTETAGEEEDLEEISDEEIAAIAAELEEDDEG